MIFFKKIVSLSVCALFAAVVFTGSASAQNRDRVVKTTSSQPTNMPPNPGVSQPPAVKPTIVSRPTLTNEIRVVRPDAAYEPPLVKKTGSSLPASPAAMAASGRTVYGPTASM